MSEISKEEIVEACLKRDPYTNYTFTAQNGTVECQRATRYARTIAHEVLRAAKEAVAWISVAEQMPKRYTPVLVRCDDGTVPLALLAWDGQDWRVGVSDTRYAFRVGHWQHVPSGALPSADPRPSERNLEPHPERRVKQRRVIVGTYMQRRGIVHGHSVQTRYRADRRKPTERCKVCGNEKASPACTDEFCPKRVPECERSGCLHPRQCDIDGCIDRKARTSSPAVAALPQEDWRGWERQERERDLWVLDLLDEIEAIRRGQAITLGYDPVQKLRLTTPTREQLLAAAPQEAAPGPHQSCHKHVTEYDGAYFCTDCGAQWGALPGHPAEPTACERQAPREAQAVKEGTMDDVPLSYVLAAKAHVRNDPEGFYWPVGAGRYRYIALSATPAPGQWVSDEWLLQDTRQHVGNDVMFWAAGGGYTTDVSKAERFTQEKAERQQRIRDTDMPWPLAYINGKTRPVVDFQYLDRAAALPASPEGRK